MAWIVLGLVVAATPAFGQRSKRGCADTPIDSSTVGAPIYQACHVDRAARETGVRPEINWSPGGGEARNGACFRAEFRFVVDTLGVPELGTVQVVSSSNAGFTQAVREGIRQLRYAPARLAGRPVRQVVTYRESEGLLVTTRPLGSSGAPAERPPRC
ncbi:MAG: hypothetical protein JNL44_15855 [Gemmatimonadetes bacterium]|nr:hypothetical protein [Gemmatimonadota bacterium]